MQKAAICIGIGALYQITLIYELCLRRAVVFCMQGDWVNGQYHGKGKYEWADGRCYEGDWEENRMHGQGVFTDINGHRWVVVGGELMPTVLSVCMSCSVMQPMCIFISHRMLRPMRCCPAPLCAQMGWSVFQRVRSRPCQWLMRSGCGLVALHEGKWASDDGCMWFKHCAVAWLQLWWVVHCVFKDSTM